MTNRISDDNPHLRTGSTQGACNKATALLQCNGGQRPPTHPVRLGCTCSHWGLCCGRGKSVEISRQDRGQIADSFYKIKKSRPQTTFLLFPSRRPQTAKRQGAGPDVCGATWWHREGENFSRLPQGKKFRPPCLSLTGGTRDKLVRCGRGHIPGRPSPRSDTRESGGSKGVEGQCPSTPLGRRRSGEIPNQNEENRRAVFN